MNRRELYYSAPPQWPLPRPPGKAFAAEHDHDHMDDGDDTRSSRDVVAQRQVDRRRCRLRAEGERLPAALPRAVGAGR